MVVVCLVFQQQESVKIWSNKSRLLKAFQALGSSSATGPYGQLRAIVFGENEGVFI